MNLNVAIQKIKQGKAICFLGAGFSVGAQDANGQPVFNEKELRKELFRISGEPFDEQIPLSDIANFCQRKNSETSKQLFKTILNRFTLVRPTNEQKEILSHPWRSTFTTNYDDIPEQIWNEEHIQIFSPIDPNKTLMNGRRLFYLHGRGRDIRENDVDPCLILSSREYAKSNKSHNKLRDYFTNEMATSEAIIFIGYSARDLDFTRSLASLGGQIKERTLFIEAPDIGPIDRSRIEEYGSIESIGTQGFAKALRETDVPTVLLQRPRLIREIVLSDGSRTSPAEVVDTDIHKQLLTGTFNTKGYRAQKREIRGGGSANPSCVERIEKLERTFKLIDDGNLRVVVTSDIGNGKTFFLRQVEQRGLEEGYRVFRIDSAGPEYSSELNNLFEKPGKKLFVVDDAVRYQPQIQLIGARLTNECGLVISNFNGIDKIGIHDLREIVGGQVFEVNLDKMTVTEVDEWVKYLNRWGLWGEELGGGSEVDKRNYILGECGSEVRSLVIGVYKNSKIASRISKIVDFFLGRPADKNNVDAFIGAVITSLVDKHVDWKNVVDWLDIDEAKFINDLRNNRINEILMYEMDAFALPSKQLARFFLESEEIEVVKIEEIASIYVCIVLGTARQLRDPRKSDIARQNLKELMRFRILSLLFGTTEDGLRIIASIYNKLSSDYYIQKIDQFWLQFAMARMADEDLHLAEAYLKNAIGIARGHGQNWETKQIDDQFVRLWLRKSILKERPNKSELLNAIRHLEVELKNPEGGEIYPLRSAKLIEELLEKHIDDLDLEVCKKFESILLKMREVIGDRGKLNFAERGETEVLRKCIKNALLVANSR